MSKENGVIDDVEIIPDFENEMIEETPPVQKSGGCGCNKNKANRINDIPSEEIPKTNWLKIGLIVGGLMVVYYLYKNSKGKVSLPKVEVPAV